MMVLGHSRCGAVTAAVTEGKAEGNIGAILETISPAVEAAQSEAKGKGQAEIVEAAADQNVRLVCSSLIAQSKIVEHLVDHGKLKIVGAKYDLDDGKVSCFDKK